MVLSAVLSAVLSILLSAVLSAVLSTVLSTVLSAVLSILLSTVLNIVLSIVLSIVPTGSVVGMSPPPRCHLPRHTACTTATRCTDLTRPATGLRCPALTHRRCCVQVHAAL